MHLFSTLVLNEYKPLDLGVTQKSFRVEKRERERDQTRSFHENLEKRE